MSIKTPLRITSTLLNSGKPTNLIYQVEASEMLFDSIASINSISSKNKIRDRISKIYKLGGEFIFDRFENGKFRNNLVLIDSRLPEIVSHMVLTFYSTGENTLGKLCETMKGTNPLNFNQDDNNPFYEYKIKRFLTDIALGMMPSVPWEGKLDATGGYLVVKSDGEIVCYHIYNRNEFEDYLLANTKFETASSTRHGFGTLYIENGKLFFKLNLQIRFLK